MVAITNVLLFALTASASVVKRTYATVNSDLQKLNSDTTTLKNAITSWDGTVSNAIPIQNAYNTLDSDIKSTTTDVNGTSTFTSAQSTSLLSYINKTLEPNVLATINALINAKAKFTNVGLAGTVKNDLATLQTDEAALGKALVSKSSSDQKTNAQSAQNKIAADIQKGVSAYASS